jgi:SAM-dependent methyltransferase
MPMLSYPDKPNVALLDRIPLDARVVVDVGCGTGSLGGEYKRRNPACLYLGIELDAEAAAIARTRLDDVAVVDVEKNPFPFAAPQADCIIYGDSLEHFIDPWAVLAAHAKRLAETGTALICIPNADHWSFADRLLRGTFDYAAQGLFDRTHLRWFTWEMTRKAILAAGLKPHDVMGRVFDEPGAEAFVNAVAPALRALGVERDAYLRRAAPLQYVWRARRAALPQLTVVSTMLAPVGGVSHVRVIEPLRAIATDPTVSTMVASGFEAESLPAETPKIFIFHRPLLDGVASLDPIRRLIALGYVVVCEFDDHPDYIPVLQGKDVQNFRAVHAVQTSTEPLAEVLRPQNPEIAVFPNAITRLPDPRNHANPARQTLFFGGLNRDQDWPPCIEALNTVARFAGERLFFQIVNDRALFDALDTPHKNFTPLCEYDVYLDLLAQSEISFMPLADTPFNRCKSDLKFLEASALRVTALASPVVYDKTIVDGRTGLLFRDTSELQQRLARLVADPDFGRALGDAARAYVEKHRMLAYQTARRVAWYRALWARRAELNVALLARVPELAEPAAAVERPVEGLV